MVMRYALGGVDLRQTPKYVLFFLLVSTLCLPAPGHGQTNSQSSVITLSAMGDIMMGSHFPSDDWLPEDDGASLFINVRSFLSSSDIVFGNLEGALLDEGECVKKCDDPETCYAFKMPQRYAGHLVDAGFNLMSIANNHIGDFGITGIDSTVRTLAVSGIHFAGVHSHPNTIFELNGVMVGFAAFSPNLAAPDPRDIQTSVKVIEKLSRLCDMVIVSVHAGGEGDKHRHVTRQTETYHNEDRGNVYAFAHAVVDAGADVVLGHGPHVTRAMELYKGRLIAYSLGNFCTYGRFNLKGHNGTAPLLQIKTTRDGEFLEGLIIPIFQTPKKGPAPDPKNRAIKDIVELTKKDFPETPLLIDISGKISVQGRGSCLQNK